VISDKIRYGHKKDPEYAHRHVAFYVSEKDILKEEAVGKDLNKLVANDFQEWFIDFYWNKARGIARGVDVYGNNISIKDLQEIFYSMYIIERKEDGKTE
jgi:hypothetical protein